MCPIDIQLTSVATSEIVTADSPRIAEVLALGSPGANLQNHKATRRFIRVVMMPTYLSHTIEALVSANLLNSLHNEAVVFMEKLP